MIRIRQSAAIYFAFQGVAVIAWWLLLIFVPSSRRYFQMESDSQTSLMALWLADLSLLALGSLATSWLCFRNDKHAPIALWFVCGAFSYATLGCVAFAFLSDAGWLGVTLMVPAMLWNGCFSMALTSVREMMFRQAKSASTQWILAKTLIQIVVVWSVVLVVIPFFITVLEDKLGIARLSFPFQKPLSVLFFIAIGSLGLLSANIMARIGRGTPLPLDAATNLVISGTYSYVRNPMAISGIGQGLAVALFLGSPLVLSYALMGAFIWQLIFRVLEEDDLRKRFGADYEDYCRQIRCWFPRRQPYRRG